MHTYPSVQNSIFCHRLPCICLYPAYPALTSNDGCLWTLRGRRSTREPTQVLEEHANYNRGLVGTETGFSAYWGKNSKWQTQVEVQLHNVVKNYEKIQPMKVGNSGTDYLCTFNTQMRSLSFNKALNVDIKR